MHRPPTSVLVMVAGPPLLLAGLGLAHPMTLTAGSAAMWQHLHTVLLPVFPLLALGPWVLVRRENRAVVRLVAVLGFVYAVFYTALDVLAGIGAGALQRYGGAASTSVMFTQGNNLATVAVWAYLAATVIAAGLAVSRAGRNALPGAVIVVAAAWSFLTSHIYWPTGVLTMLALAIGWLALAVAAVPAGKQDQHSSP